MPRNTSLRTVVLAGVAAFALAGADWLPAVGPWLGVGASCAFAETTETDAVTLGALTERADLTALVRVIDRAPSAAADADAPAGTEVWRVRVEETLRGALGPGAAAEFEVRIVTGRAAVAKGGLFLAFLRRTDRGWGTLELPWAFRTTAEPGVTALVDYTRGFAARLGADGRALDAEALAAHMVAGIASTAGGVPFSAGRDLLRHEEAVAALTPPLRAQLTDALAAPRRADDDFASVVLAAGRFGGPGTEAVLVDRLLDPAARAQRRNIVAAMARRGSPELVTLLATRLAAIRAADAADLAAVTAPSGAEPVTSAERATAAAVRLANRADIANALGRIARPDCAAPLLSLVADADPAVRVEAAHGLGLLARAVREPKPGVAAEAPRPRLDAALEPLVALATGRAGVGETENERCASVWALGQIDTQPAWDALRTLAKDHPAPRVRELARQVLERPRVALLLAGE